MTTANPVDLWKKKSAREVVLPSGIEVTIQLTSVADQIIAGSFSGVVLGIAKQYEKGEIDRDAEITDDRLKSFKEFMHTLVARSVTKVEGKEVTLTAEDVAGLPQDDVERIWNYAVRVVPLPMATA